jgi:hypothetical protein
MLVPLIYDESSQARKTAALRREQNVQSIACNEQKGFDHRIGHFRPLRMVTRVLECHIYLRLGGFGLENRLLGWPTP